MSDDKIIAVLAARASRELIPEGLRDELVLSDSYVEKAALVRTQTVSFGASGPSLDAKELLNGVRTALSSGSSVELTDKATGAIWICRKSAQTEDALLEKGETSLPYPYSFALHPNQAVRLSGLEKVARDAEFEGNDLRQWTTALSEGPLSDKLLDELDADFSHSPARIELKVREVFSQKSIELSALVPDDAIYYDRLIGALTHSQNIDDFIQNELSDKLRSLSKFGGAAALHRALLLHGHQNIAGEIVRHFTDLSEHQRIRPPDLMSKVEMLEILSAMGGSETSAIVELSQIIREAVELTSTDAALLEALFSFVEGYLARTGTLAERPPFWRRMASLAHAAVIWRMMPKELRAVEDFRRHLLEATRFEFTLANMLDLSVAPRWLPTYASADHLRAEVLGRIAVAVGRVATAQPGQADLEAELQALKDKLTGFFAVAAFMPGPCEGAFDARIELAEEAKSDIEANLRARPISIEALRTLFANSLVFRVDEMLSKLAVDAVRELTSDAMTTRTNEAVAELLPQLAQLAAVTRSQDLFVEVKILCRLIRRLGTRKISPMAEAEVVLIASAAWPSDGDYNRELGSWFEELSLSEMNASDASALANCLDFLAYVKPRLWQYLAPAMAAAQIKALAPVPA